MIKICHIANLITGKADGVYTHLLMLLNNLDKNRYEQILIFQGGEKVKNEMKRLNVKTYEVKSLRTKISIKSFIEIYRILIKENVDIIHAHLLKPYAIAGIINLMVRRKLVFNYHGLFINNLYYNWVEKTIYKIIHYVVNKFNAVNLVLAPSNYSKKLIVNETKLFKKIKVYYNSYSETSNDKISDSISNELININRKYFLIGVVSRIEVQKRIDRALEILKIITQKHSDVYFVFFGDGPLLQEMESKASDIGVKDYCTFFGFVENAPAYMHRFDLLLLTSDWEGMPLVIWEAMAKGIPIISTNVGGTKEIIETEQCGIIFNKENTSEAAEIISSLLQQDEKRMSMGGNGINAIRNKYTIKNFTNSFDQFYSELIED
jgi:glycosyltransferase involved in cell wall biosynthesis